MDGIVEDPPSGAAAQLVAEQGKVSFPGCSTLLG